MARNKRYKEQIDPWVYHGKTVDSLEEMPEHTYGFVYLITNNKNGKKYVGKKAVLSVSYKVEYVEGKRPGRLRKVKVPVYRESTWRNYFGSGQEIIEAVKQEGKDNFTREILRFVPTKKLLTYYEMKELCERDVLESDEYYNDNILAKFYRKDFKSESIEESSEKKTGNQCEEKDI